MTTQKYFELPATYKALLLKSRRDPYDIEVVTKPMLQAGPGSAVIRVLAANVLTYSDQIYTGRRPYPYPTPFTPGCSAFGRVAAVGLDATTLQPGQLVFFDLFIRGRDNPDSLILSGVFDGLNPASKKLMAGEWRDSTYAEYAKVPLENCFSLNETLLLGSPADGNLGYKTTDLLYLSKLAVTFGGLRDVNVRAGETVVIVPATGAFGGAAVLAALAMGAKVIAMGRNQEALDKLKAFDSNGRVRTVRNSGDVNADIQELTKYGPLDVFFDISPESASESTHFTSCIQSLRRGGRVSLMGAPRELSLPAYLMMHNDITLKGKWMYTPDDVRFVIKLVEKGFIRLGEAGGIRTVGTFALEDFADAFAVASNMSGPWLQAAIVP
jgi:threonine dehydrogenase-like Zn-dependent dehydrogenase